MSSDHADPISSPRRRGSASSILTRLGWRLRSTLSPERRATVRRATDPLVGPLGSIRGAKTDVAVALTFDDGPGPATPGVLDALADFGATATFFVLVPHAEAHPEIVRRMIDEGHEVALHGVDHRRLPSLPPKDVRPHIAEGKRRLEACTGEPVHLFRPPYGSQTPRTFADARRCGLTVTVWSSDADDWIDHTATEIAFLAVDRVVPGGVLLLHDRFVSDPSAPLPEPNFDRAEVVELTLAGLRRRGLTGCSVRDLVGQGRARRTAWFRM